jgi:hypothetical protein
MDKLELVKKLESINTALSGDLKEKQKFIDLMREDEDPKKIFGELRQTVGEALMLLKAQDLKELLHPKNKAIVDAGSRTGAMVCVRPVAEEYENKTFVGFLIGEAAMGSSIKVEDNKLQLNFGAYNPAIFVPELGKVIYGMQSWWGIVESEEDFKQITDEDIENVWYVKAFRERLEKAAEEEE